MQSSVPAAGRAFRRPTWVPLSIAANTALFSLLGTTYGGDGRTTFALPDLRGRVSVGASDTIPLGMTFGEESTTLTLAKLPEHAHALPGDGVSTFALPDLLGRTTVSTGPGFPVGEVFGGDTNTLSIANLAPHAHTLPEVTGIPEPATLALIGLAIGVLGFGRRRQAAPA